MDIERLREEAVEILGEEDLAGLMKWYEDTLESGWSYVVFVVRRSYILALIMEALTGKKMEESSRACFLTDASLFLQCEKLARVYRRYQRFPDILLCDETIVYGKNINHLIEMMEEELISLLGEYEKDDIKDALAGAIQIHAYVRSEKPLLLLGRYQLHLQYQRSVDLLSLHRLSSNLSTLILHSDIANAVYVYSEHLTESQFRKVDRTGYVETVYQGTKQYTKIDFIGGQERKAIFSLRIIKNAGQEGYRIIPLVFMPNLSGEETEGLFRYIEEKLQLQGEEEFYIGRIRKWQALRGKRTFNELITLLLSMALLQEFHEENDIDVTSIQAVCDREYEICKLARNYNENRMEETEAFLQGILFRKLFSAEELAWLVNKVIERDRKLIRTMPGGRVVLREKEKQAVRERLEDYFWEREMEEESAAYKLSWEPYYPTRRRSERRVRGCGFLLWEISEGYTEQEAGYCVAFFLQMMDAGVLALSSYASKDTRVVGFSQFAKAGELSQMIKPIRMLEWMPIIVAVEEEGEWSGRSFCEVLERYGESPECDIEQEKIAEIVRFQKELLQMGQRAGDWDWSYVEKKDPDDFPGDGFEGVEEEKLRFAMTLRFLDRQLRHIRHYSKYRENRNR